MQDVTIYKLEVWRSGLVRYKNGNGVVVKEDHLGERHVEDLFYWSPKVQAFVEMKAFVADVASRLKRRSHILLQGSDCHVYTFYR